MRKRAEGLFHRAILQCFQSRKKVKKRQMGRSRSSKVTPVLRQLERTPSKNLWQECLSPAKCRTLYTGVPCRKSWHQSSFRSAYRSRWRQSRHRSDFAAAHCIGMQMGWSNARAIICIIESLTLAVPYMPNLACSGYSRLPPPPTPSPRKRDSFNHLK